MHVFRFWFDQNNTHVPEFTAASSSDIYLWEEEKKSYVGSEILLHQ